jgi:hypothetical protein
MTHGAASPGRRLLLFGLLAVTTLALLLRVPSAAEPLGIDQGFWSSAAHQMARGQVLYREVWDHKPPGSFLMYLSAFTLFGWNTASVAWFDILASAAAALLIFAIGRRSDGVIMGAAAAAIYATMTMPAWLYRHGGFLERSVAETYIVVLVGTAALCAVHLRDRPSTSLAVILGLSGGAAVLLKPNAGIYLPALAIWLFAYFSGPRRHAIRTILIAAAASVVPLGVTVVWLWAIGALPDARVALIDFNRAYVSQGFTPSGYALAFSKAVFLRMKTEPLWTAGGIGALAAAWDLARTRKVDPLAGLAVALGAGAAIAIIANGAWLFNSYFIQAQPALALMAAWLLVSAWRPRFVHRPAAIALVLIGAALLFRGDYVGRIFEYAVADLEQLRGMGDRTAYLERFGSYANNRGYSARANEELIAYLRQRTGRDDRLYLFGINGSTIYFSTDRLMANRFLRVNVFVPSTFGHPGFSLRDVTRELDARRPVYIIFEELHSPSAMGVAVDHLQQDPDVLRLLAAYRLETRIEDFTLYRRAD